MRARSALFTLFGDVVRPAGGHAWLTALTACMGALGFSPQATRTALHRMAGEGWVAPTRVGRFAAYRLTAKGVDRLEQAAARIYRLRAAPWDGRWHLLVSAEAARTSAAQRELQWLGYGRLAPDVWVSPHPQADRLDAAVAAHGLHDAARFTAAESTDAAAIVGRAWDLTELRDAHAEFLRTWEGVGPAAAPEAAFTSRIRLVHHWRSFLFLDPGLPPALLPADWLGDRAAAVFRARYEAVDAAAWQFYDDLTANAPPVAADVHTSRLRGNNPFVHGLDALAAGRPA